MNHAAIHRANSTQAHTGLSFPTVSTEFRAVPEQFVKLPKVAAEKDK